MVEVQLLPEDRIILCSDGIVEADNPAGEQLGYEQTTETIRLICEDGLSAEATIDRILDTVATFKGDTPQSDDITCIVVQAK